MGKVRSLGLARLVEDDLEAKRYVQSIMTLSFLPKEEIQEQFNYIVAQLNENIMNRFIQFTDYFQSFWINRVGTSQFSIFGLQLRTNNSIESFHSRLEAKLSRRPQPWEFFSQAFFK